MEGNASESDASTTNISDNDDASVLEEPELEEESYLEWLKRATGIAEHVAVKAGVEDWVKQQRRRKWSWAGHVARRTDGR